MVFIKQLTCTEKQHLETKIEEEKERQRVRRMNPNTPVVSVETNFIFNNLYKYGMLAIILGLLGISVRHLLKWRDFAYDEYGNLIVALMLFFHHIAHSFTKTGWKSRVMKTVARVWIVIGSVYIFFLIFR